METNEQENTNPTTEQDAAEATAIKAAATAPEQEATSAPEQEAPPENDAAATAESPDETADTTDNAAREEEKNDGETAVPDETAAPAEPDWKEMYARTMADFDNFRKRTARDREELFKSAAADILKDLLPTVDNLALALDKAADKEDPFVKGVQLVYDGLVKMLADHGAVPVDSLGEPLDTNFHEAIATLPSPEVPEGHVMTEVKRGWLLNGKVLRAAQVVVSAGKGE